MTTSFDGVIETIEPSVSMGTFRTFDPLEHLYTPLHYYTIDLNDLKSENWCSSYTPITSVNPVKVNYPAGVCLGVEIEFDFDPPTALTPSCSDVTWIYSIYTDDEAGWSNSDDRISVDPFTNTIKLYYSGSFSTM